MSSNDEDLTMGADEPKPVERPRRRGDLAAAHGPRRALHGCGARGAGEGGARRGVAQPRTANWEPPPQRPDPVELLEEQAKTRVPELVPIRYGRMLVSPFTFYRGAAYLMASDLASGASDGAPHAALR